MAPDDAQIEIEELITWHNNAQMQLRDGWVGFSDSLVADQGIINSGFN